MCKWALALVAASLGSQPAAPGFKLGALPSLPDATVGSGEVLLEVPIDASGRAGSIRTLRDSPPYTEALRSAIAGWLFEPARDAAGKPAAGVVLVAGSYRPATVIGPAQGEAPKDVAVPGAAVPFPVKTVPAPYPPLARGDAVVLVEIAVATDGTATPRVARGAPGFDDAALQSAREWRFRPTPGGGRAYVVYGFRRPWSM
jgi:outer membrane biosynthesis protein TonB